MLHAFLPHLDTAGMAESFVRLVGADEQVTLNAQPEALAWVAETDILSRLLDRSCFPILPAVQSHNHLFGAFALKTKAAQHLSAWPQGIAPFPSLLRESFDRMGGKPFLLRDIGGWCWPCQSGVHPPLRSTSLESTHAAGWMRMLQRGSMGTALRCWRP